MEFKSNAELKNNLKNVLKVENENQIARFEKLKVGPPGPKQF